jgi:hypothetical protein
MNIKKIEDELKENSHLNTPNYKKSTPKRIYSFFLILIYKCKTFFFYKIHERLSLNSKNSLYLSL